MNTKDLKSKTQAIEPCVRIGKNGLTDTMISEIIKNIKKHKLIKVKLLKSFIHDKDKKQVAQEIAEKTKSKIVKITGFVIVLFKR